MRTVSQYIQTLLFEHDYVTVPNLGAFIANYQPSGFNEISGSLMPPQKRIAFNEVLRQDDGLLAMYIARRENISIEEAKKRIQNFVTEVKGRLFLDRYFDIDRVGKFSLNEENNLVFEPDRKANYYSESFGFDSLYPRRTEKEINLYNNQVILEEASDDFMPSYVTPQRKPSFLKRIALYSLPVIMLTAGLVYVLLSPQNQVLEQRNKPSLSSVNPLDYLPKTTIVTSKEIVEEPKEEILKPVLKAPVKAVEVKKTEPIVEKKKISETKVEVKSTPVEDKKLEVVSAPKTEKTIESPSNTNSKQYKIIAGLFRNTGNAERQKQKLFANGFDKVQLIPKSTFICVIAAETENQEDAKRIAKKVSTVIGENAIIQ